MWLKPRMRQLQVGARAQVTGCKCGCCGQVQPGLHTTGEHRCLGALCCLAPRGLCAALCAALCADMSAQGMRRLPWCSHVTSCGGMSAQGTHVAQGTRRRRPRPAHHIYGVWIIYCFFRLPRISANSRANFKLAFITNDRITGVMSQPYISVPVVAMHMQATQRSVP